uniref:Pleckstrin homology domain containing, family H (With MyTH4 domain) member 2 n=1 Tax=Mesocestoides corti TaxID=53468 RepID=A0A5K3FZ90_MESCO
SPSAEYPSPRTKKTGTTEQALLTNHEPEPHTRRRLSESSTLATPLLLYHFSTVSVSGWLDGNGKQRGRGLAESGVVQNFCELIRHHTSMEKWIQQKDLLTIGKEIPWVRRKAPFFLLLLTPCL